MNKRITEKVVKDEFDNAQIAFDYCWDLLVDLKEFTIKDNDFGQRFILFQDQLAETIFRLQSIRDKILAEQKHYEKNRVSYNFKWFKDRMRHLTAIKEGIDKAVNIGKALGDAYAHFFYQNDLKLLAEHLSHQRVVNHTAGMGERGELAFLKNIKQIEGQFTLFHGITNNLRYGDFSFIDLKTLRVIQIGELKTKTIDEQNLDVSLTLLKRKDNVKVRKEPFKDVEMEKTRRGRQILGIANFLTGFIEPNTENTDLLNQSYAAEIDDLVKTTPASNHQQRQVSPGLAFLAVKFKGDGLFKRIYYTKSKAILNKNPKQITEVAMKLIKPGSHNNILFSQLLYHRDFSNKDTPGTIPLFWLPIGAAQLKQLYFADCIVMSIYNPAHLVDDIQDMGFVVHSDYAKKPYITEGKKMEVQNFDRFIGYITDHLLTENFVIDAIKEVQKSDLLAKGGKVRVKPQQHADIFRRKGNI